MIKTNHKNIRSTTSFSFSALLAAHSCFYGILTRVRQSAPPEECVNFREVKTSATKSSCSGQSKVSASPAAVWSQSSSEGIHSHVTKIFDTVQLDIVLARILLTLRGTTECRWALHKNEQPTYTCVQSILCKPVLKVNQKDLQMHS